MRVLVTGQSGFTGRYLTAALARAGHETLPFTADITDAAAVAGTVRDLRPDGFIHLAAKAFVQSDDVAGFYAVNQLGSFHLLEAAASSARGPFLVASSGLIYGNALATRIGEDTPPNPANHYAVSKLAMEWGARQWGAELPLIIARPFNYTGCGQELRYVVPKIVDHYRRRAPTIELGNLSPKRDFGDVRAVVDAYVGLLGKGEAGTFNVCSGEAVSLHEVIALCSELTGHQPRIDINPDFVRANDVAYLSGDPSRLQAALPDWHPIAFRETLAWMLAGVDGREHPSE